MTTDPADMLSQMGNSAQVPYERPAYDCQFCHRPSYNIMEVGQFRLHADTVLYVCKDCILNHLNDVRRQ